MFLKVVTGDKKFSDKVSDRKNKKKYNQKRDQSGQDELLSDVIRKHETCRECDRVWNVSNNSVYKEGEYLCPHCSYKKSKKKENEVKGKSKRKNKVIFKGSFKSSLERQKNKYKGMEV